jgi:hypothetical protein
MGASSLQARYLVARSAQLVSTVAVALLAVACTNERPVTELAGSCGDVYKSQVCTWATMKGATVVTVGVTVPIASIENAPSAASMDWPPKADAVLDVPEAARKESGLNHFTLYWEATGHAPGPYLTPHFDFHFYTIGSTERMSIDCKDVTKPTALPTGYELPDVPLPPEMAKMIGVPALIGLCVPQMGMHSMLGTELASTGTFRGDMVIGYAKGKPVFIEPMISKGMLLEKKSFDLAIPSVPGIGAHPTKFHADWDASKQSYRFVLSEFAAAS